MRRLLPVAIAGPFAGAALWAALRILTPASAREIDDPWADHFRAGGFDARVRSISRQPAQHFALIDRRDEFKGDAAMEATVLRQVEVQGANLQIAEFQSEELAARIVEDETRRRVPRSGKRMCHVQRVGRIIGILTPQDADRSQSVDAGFAQRVLKSFAERAETLR